MDTNHLTSNDRTAHTHAGQGPHYLMLGNVFADAGEAIGQAVLPNEPPPVDRERLRTAFAKHCLSAYSFPTEAAQS